MAVIPVEKVHIVVHKGVKEKFLQDLQRQRYQLGISQRRAHPDKLSPTLPLFPRLYPRLFKNKNICGVT